MTWISYAERKPEPEPKPRRFVLLRRSFLEGPVYHAIEAEYANSYNDITHWAEIEGPGEEPELTLQAAQVLIGQLVLGIQNWAADEDGVHPSVWEAYKRGKAIVGKSDWKEEQ